VKIAFAGKGGSGKTTLSSLFVRHLASPGLPVVAIDADINQHLAEALGADEPQPMGAHLTEIKEYLRGSNPRIGSAAAMVKTTPPGRGSRLLRPGGPDPLHALGMTAPCGALLLATGPFEDDDLGVSCYHAKTGAVELYLNHLVDGSGEYVVVDCTAGADSFASGLFTRFDLTVLVAEPARKGISVYRQWQGYAEGFDVPVALVGNKVQTPEDLAFLRSQAAEEPLAWVGHVPAVRAMEQGRPFSLDHLSPDTAAALSAIKSRLDAAPRDWARYTTLASEFHERNVRAWAGDKLGEDLTAQIDPRLHPRPARTRPRRRLRNPRRITTCDRRPSLINVGFRDCQDPLAYVPDSEFHVGELDRPPLPLASARRTLVHIKLAPFPG
jgi:CO dehydrogenase maturation factor